MDRIKEILSGLDEPAAPKDLELKIMDAIYKNSAPEFKPKRIKPLISYGLTCIAAAIIAFILLNTSVMGAINETVGTAKTGFGEFIQSTQMTLIEYKADRFMSDELGGNVK